jgi:hypothetical protein
LVSLTALDAGAGLSAAADDGWSIWDAAADPGVLFDGLGWPQLRRLQRAAAALAQQAAASSRIDRLVAAAHHARRLLSATPLAPDSSESGLRELADSAEQFAAAAPGHSAAVAVGELAAAARGLLSCPSPVAGWVEATIACFGADSEGRNDVVLVVPLCRLLDPVRGWLEEQELFADVATPTALRHVAAHQVALVLGDLGEVYSSPWRDHATAARQLGWLLTAPPGRAVRWAVVGAAQLAPQRYWLLGDGQHPRLAVTTHTLGGVGNQPDELAGSGPALLVPYEAALDCAASYGAVGQLARLAVARPSTDANADTISATPTLLASGHTVYFDATVGARPLVVLHDEDTATVALVRMRPGALRAGMLLALRAGDVEHTELAARADRWLRERKRWRLGETDEVRATVAAVHARLTLVRSVLGTGTVVRDVRDQLARHCPELAAASRGDYARLLATAPLDPAYIAPRRPGGFAALTAALNCPELADDFARLVMLRAAHQQAGEEIRRELLALLAEQRDWADEIDERGWAVLCREHIGELLLAAVVSTGEAPAVVPRTWLGHLIDPNGRRAAGTSLTRGVL